MLSPNRTGPQHPSSQQTKQMMMIDQSRQSTEVGFASNNGHHQNLVRRNAASPRGDVHDASNSNGSGLSMPTGKSSSPDSVAQLPGNSTATASNVPYSASTGHGHLYQSNGYSSPNSKPRLRPSPTNGISRSMHSRSKVPSRRRVLSWCRTRNLRTAILLGTAMAALAYSSLLCTMVLAPTEQNSGANNPVLAPKSVNTNDNAKIVSITSTLPIKLSKQRTLQPRVIQLMDTHNYRRISRTGQHNGGKRLRHHHLIMELGTPPEGYNTTTASNYNSSISYQTNQSEVVSSFDQPESKDELLSAQQTNVTSQKIQSIEDTAVEKKDVCVPLADWQTKSFVNCNVFHEVDMILGTAMSGVNISKIHRNQTHYESITSSTQLDFLGQGWFRSTWKLQDTYDHDSLVLKTLRIEREFLDEYYDLHRRDAVAMERLTHSPFIMNVFGYCGQSAINELANFKDKSVTSLEVLDRRFRGRTGFTVDLVKLRLATSIAIGVSHIHGANRPRDMDEDDGARPQDYLPAMVHYDLNPRNIAIVKGGKPKLNDFNICEFLKYNPATNETCGFPSRLHEPWWRAPEEMNTDKSTTTLLNEKVDVYALGSILFHILTTHSPRGKMKRERMEEVRTDVRKGIAPTIPEEFRKGAKSNRAVRAFVEAMDLCFVENPDDRASASEIADILYKALERIKKEESGYKQKAKKH